MRLIERYAAHLPVTDRTPRLTLGEGNTPLLRAEALGHLIGCELHLKVEGQNPTGSFKDRGMVLAVAKAIEAGSRIVICASTGNTSASAAAYAARAGISAAVVVPAGRIARGKLAQAVAYGARIVPLEGNFDEALAIVRQLAAEHADMTLVNSVNPFRLEGQKTAAFELCDELGRAPDILALPVGNAGNISAYHLGFRRYLETGVIERLPRLFGFQAEGAAPLARGLEAVENPETVATAIRIGRPASAQLARAAVADTAGRIDAVSDREILAAQRLLAEREGVFAEPASAAPIAGLLKLSRSGQLPGGLLVVVVLTGSGLKDPDTALLGAPDFAQPVPARRDAVLEALRGAD